MRGSVTYDAGVASTWRWRLVNSAPDETVDTGSANWSRRGWPEATVKKWAFRCALGVISVRFRCSVLPVSQATELGRLTTTWTESVVWAGIFPFGQICWPDKCTGMADPVRPP